MKIKFVYPRWPKLKQQTEFHLPPHAPVCVAAAIPDDIEVVFFDENVQEIDFGSDADLVAISVLLTCQIPRAWEIADRFRNMRIPVIFGGIAATLHYEETLNHADAVFLGEVEGRFEEIINDFSNKGLKKVYDYMHKYPDMDLIGPAKRSILTRNLYNYRGVQMVDLVHASRGCKFNCFPCCTPYLGGRNFRPRSIKSVVEELEQIDNNRLFFVDNSLAQDDDWEKELFKALIPLKKKWISHPIKDDDEILDLAAEAGCWYVYQAIVDTSETIKHRIRRLKDRGIGVEGTIILGMDDHDEDYIKRLVDYLIEIDLDLAEFTILTPFPHTPIRAALEKEKRILHSDWARYTAGEVVFQPAKMSADRLQEMYYYAWDTFYGYISQEVRMAKLFLNVINKEKQTGSYHRVRLKKLAWE